MSSGARKSQQKYPIMASTLSVKIRMPKVLSFIGWFTFELNTDEIVCDYAELVH